MVKAKKQKCLCCKIKFNNLHARGLCHSCYDKEKIKGRLDNYSLKRTKTNEIIEHENFAEIIIYTNQGEKLIATIDKEDIEKVKYIKWNYYKLKGVILNYKVGNLSRYILDLKDLTKNVEFKNKDKLDCRKENLEIVSRGNNNPNYKK